MQGCVLNYRLFKAFYNDFDDDASVLLFYADITWLYKGRVLTRFFECEIEIEQFLQEQKIFLLHTFKSPSFPPMFANLVNVF